MPRCRQCQRALDAEPPPPPAGGVLSESYVLLPLHVTASGMLPLGDSAVGFGSADFFLSASSSSVAPARGAERRFEEQYFGAETRAPPPPTPVKGNSPSPRFSNASAHAFRDKPTALGDSVSAAAMAHAELSEHVQLITTHHAHCAGVPVTTPACKECVDSMLLQIDSQAERARSDKRSFAGYLHSAGSSMRNEEIEQVNERINYYEEELAALQENLALMEKERAEIHERQSSLSRDAAALAHEEALMWQELNELHFLDETFSDLRDGARATIDGIERQIASIQRINILADLFAISHNGPYATINSFRVGQVASAPVEWNEINAGLGEAALLLQTLANHIGLEFADFKIVPLGSFSKIVRFTNLRMEYSLHGSDQDNFAESHFNLGLGAWITCLRQLLAAVASADPTFRAPYKISKHAINGHSVLFLKNKQTEWTKALKYALTNLKWLLAWTSTAAAARLKS
ncbi:hypothetical protein PybrP1_012789 [[Pythium] brassicae (nom. inval.)]|nr:hypothetical protein PybrP1_012789 [[Pythium] brassicae (nom. inval.)]